ncbi:ARL14 effector protein [Nymphon striatum]|nr:ARL14 effector protein [Nymphon striatum]
MKKLTVQQAMMLAESNLSVEVEADDTDIFVLLLNFYNLLNLNSRMYMEAPQKGRSWWDTVAQCHGIDKTRALKVAKSGIYPNLLGDINSDIEAVLPYATKFIVVCYGNPNSESLSQVRLDVWASKTAQTKTGTPKLNLLPPTNETGDSFAYVGYAVFDAGSLSKMNVDFSQDSANSGKVVPYWILDTDYDSYALVWSCLEVCEGYHAEMSSLLGRSSNISDEVTSRMFGLLENGGASTRRFQSVIHSNCEGHNHVQWLEKAKARSGGLTSCDVSQHLAGNVSSCHSSSYSSEQGFISVDELSSNEKVLLMHRIGIQSAVGVNPSNICYHHKMTLLDYFDKLERTCCDPLNVHKKSSRKSLRSINMDMALYLSRQGNKKIKAGQKLCPSCRKKCCLQQNEQEMENEENHSDIPYDTHQTNQDQLSVIFTAVGCSPFKATRVGERDRSSYAKRKLSQMTEKCEELLLPYGLDAGEEKGCKNCNDLDNMVYELKEKCAISPRTMQLQILTLAPPSWTKQKTMEIFEVTKHMVEQARKLKSEKGILAIPDYKKGKVLSETVMQTVENFYQNDEISRLMPGKSDCVSVKIGGEKKHVQKRLLLANIKEIYGEYKLKYPEIRIGFSKFCELRPKWCITVGASGTHSVCVCTIHQNVKLLLAAIPKFDSDYKELLKLMMCDPLSRSCNLHLCDLCPGKQAICTAVETHLKDHELEMEDDISYTQWVSTDRTQIESCFESVQDFIGEIGVQMETLRAHNFISKSQSSFLSLSKDNLKDGEAIVLLNFAENYSFVVQDAVQGYYWDNSQATIHPFTVYHKVEGSLKCTSLCVISDHMRHDTATVNAFLCEVVPFLKSVVINIQLIMYWSDGAASQYKNYKNLQNLLKHKEDFGITAEWHFFATAHGKSPCDGIGGTVKRLARAASLQATVSRHILTPLQLYEWAKAHISGIHFFYIISHVVEDNFQHVLESRFRSLKTVPGTRTHHCFRVTNSNELCMYRISSDTLGITTKSKEKSSNFKAGMYVAAMYDADWYAGIITEVCQDKNDALIKFMHPKGPTRSLYWPKHIDECYVPMDHILCTIQELSTPSSTQKNTLDEPTFNKIVLTHREFCDIHFKMP